MLDLELDKLKLTNLVLLLNVSVRELLFKNLKVQFLSLKKGNNNDLYCKDKFK